MTPARRGEILDRWTRKRASKQPLRGGASGPDFRVFPATGARATLAALLPFGDANGLVLKEAAGIVAYAGDLPVIAGVCGTDPLRLMDKFLAGIVRMGVAGVQNFPSVGLIDGTFRTNLEEAQLGYAREVEMIRLAREVGLVTAPLVFSAEDAARMSEAGADLVVVHPGLDPGRPAKELAKLLDEVREASRKETFVLAHAGMGEVPGADGAQTA